MRRKKAKYVPPPDHPYKKSFVKMLRLARMIKAADQVTQARYQRFREAGMDQEKATLEALHLRSEDRRFAEFDGPLVLVDGKVRYRPYPGERVFPGDLVEETEAARAA